MAEQFKAEGTKAFSAKNFPLAIELYSKAIELDPQNHVLYSNRSASYASLKEFNKALLDADKTIELNPTWGKGYGRKGAALHGLGDLVGAKDAYEEALKVEPGNAQAKQGLKAVDDAIAREAAEDGESPDLGLGKMFSDPSLLAKIAANPNTKHLLADPSFMAKLQMIQRNPKAGFQEIGQDPRFMSVLAMLLGIDMSGVPAGPASGGGEPMQTDEPMRVPSPPASPPRDQPKPKSAPTATPAPSVSCEKAAADEEKAKGNEAYKARSFDTAIAHYEKAWELHKDITYLNNLSAAHFEKGEYEKSIEEAQRAVDEGREIRADFKLIAKAFGRIGTNYVKMGDYDKAIVYFQHSLTEHRTPEILAKLRDAEKTKAEHERLAYIDPGKAEAAREEGNTLFKSADYPGAVKAYTEAIKRAPDDPRGYGNRAAAYIKLASFPDAIKDCDKALSLDPNFVKAHIRKAACYFAMGEYQKSIDSCHAATTADTHPPNTGTHTREIEAQLARSTTALYGANAGATEAEILERAQRDPEVLGILQDPIMQQILGQMKEDPGAVQDHLRNPMIREKIQKLVNAGIIRLGRQ